MSFVVTSSKIEYNLLSANCGTRLEVKEDRYLIDFILADTDSLRYSWISCDTDPQDLYSLLLITE